MSVLFGIFIGGVITSLMYELWIDSPDDNQNKLKIIGVFMQQVKATDPNQVGKIVFEAKDSEGNKVKDADLSGYTVEEILSDNGSAVSVVSYDPETMEYELEFVAPDAEGEATIANVTGEITDGENLVVGFVAEQFVVASGDVATIVGSFKANEVAPA